MNARDQADNLDASSIGPIPSLNDIDPANHTVRERPEDLNQHDLDLRKNQEELSPSGSGRNYLRLAYARKARKSVLSRAIGLGRDGKTSCVSFLQAELVEKRGRTLDSKAHRLGHICGVPYLVAYYSPSAQCWTGQAYVPSNQPTPDWNCVLDTI
ncbi:hypothetical protein CEP54_014969 [Fusarium duplospermum]|uniref:Uncharacterized protein n=1 Tax=Fusarium duplospermum TaxID=1325734 RepID=A0A428NSD6_9HYPO|nr:hypothetical protein CEP54_014969 [Fusarium duplospermum]